MSAQYTSQFGTQVDVVFTLSLKNYLGASTDVDIPIHFANSQNLDVSIYPGMILCSLCHD